MTGNLIVIGVDFLARTALLTLLLWVMIKLQKFDYVLISLIAAAALASGLDMIPHIGHYLAIPVLYFCVWKITQSSLVPDAVLTVAIAYALMFLINMLVLTALIGDLRPSARLHEPDELESETNFLSAATSTEPTSGKKLPANASGPSAKTNLPASNQAQTAEVIAANFILKGIARNGDKSVVVIDTGVKTYSLFIGDLTTAKTADGTCLLRLDEVTPDGVVVEINGNRTTLRLY